MSGEELDSLAVQELLQEAKRGKERAASMGTFGWEKRKVSTNKIFLKNTLRGVVAGNRRIQTQEDGSVKTKGRKDSKMEEMSHSENTMRPNKFPRRDEDGVIYAKASGRISRGADPTRHVKRTPNTSRSKSRRGCSSSDYDGEIVDGPGRYDTNDR